jgi:aminopeptidase-like protein
MKFGENANETISLDEVGLVCHQLATELFPICRSLTGPGVRETLEKLRKHLPELAIHAVPTGTRAFDWIVPEEWWIRDGYIADESGRRIVDFNVNNLHVIGYSEPVDQWLSHDQLDQHLHSLPNQPNAIPYITSYYVRRWGFCLTHNQRVSLAPGRYHAVIDSELREGVLNYAELILPGEKSQEVLLSTYICHPSMANNELSGPVVTTALARWLMSLRARRYTYRIVFIPETIGSVVYLSRHMQHLKSHVIAGFNITCIGDDRCYSYLPSRSGTTIADRAALHVLRQIDPEFKKYTWLDRGSDERQYCAPGVDLPIATIMRSKYGEYPEYHTSLDDLHLVTPSGLQGGFDALRRAIDAIEHDVYPKVTVFCEPQLGKRGLYPTLSTKGAGMQVRAMMNLISYCDGNHSLLEIAEIIGEPIWKLMEILKPLIVNGLINTNESGASA